MDYLKIIKVKKQPLGKGGSGTTVEMVLVNGEQLANKTCSSKDNEGHAKKMMQALYSEYIVGVGMIHPNIVSYKYFMTEYNKKLKTHFFNLIMELVNG